MKTLSLCAALAALTLPLSAQKMATPAGEAPGPWLLGTIGVGKTADPKVPQTTALKGLAIRVGEKGEAAVAYDLDLCRMVGAWTGKFTTPMNLMSRGEYPTALGEVAFTTGEVPGFLLGEGTTKDTKSTKGEQASGTSESLRDLRALRGFHDTRPEPFGPLPPGQARFKGFYVNGDKTILKWDIGGTEVLEMPGLLLVGPHKFFYRTFTIAPHEQPIAVSVASKLGGQADSIYYGPQATRRGGISYEEGSSLLPGTSRRGVFWEVGGDTNAKRLDDESDLLGDIRMALPANPKESWLVILYTLGSESDIDAARTAFGASANIDLPEPKDFVKGGPARWPETVTTAGEVSDRKDEAYVVDTIRLPDPNPWGAPLFVGGFDFFPEGRAGSPKDQPPLVPGAATSAVCTFHGDVFVVSGIDAGLEKVTWRRFASGLYHALGLKIVNGEIYVTCRDGLWRLKDLNGDGECDFYEAFNFDLKVTKSFHEFVFDLQTDAAGNFYYAKAGPVKNGGRGFDQIMAHHGALLRVSPDGAKLEVMATGFRAPNGIGCGPDGQLTSGDNEGTWTPACKINWIKPGGFCGVVDLAHRPTPPVDYDRPLCWLPKRVDNSGGGKVWVPEWAKWGPWQNRMLHLSYGTCSVFGVMKEAVPQSAIANQQSAMAQGGVTRFPVNFQSGIMRARFNPADGQLYVAGLRGWQTTGVKNGAFQRVRYTGAPVRMPIELHATTKGVRLTFTCKLDPATATDPQNWNVEVWNYLWSAAYGSPEFSTIEPVGKPADAGRQGEAQFSKTQIAQKKHDPLVVKSVTLSKDEKSVFLEIPEIKPVMQMAIKFGFMAADGAELRSEVINTIHALGD